MRDNGYAALIYIDIDGDATISGEQETTLVYVLSYDCLLYTSCRDIVKLSDLLGHSSIETTRIYLLTSGAEHQRTLDRLGLIS